MKKIPLLALRAYCLILTVSLMVYGFAHMYSYSDLIQSALFIPISLYFYSATFGRLPFRGRTSSQNISKSKVYRLLSIYSGLFALIMLVSFIISLRKFSDATFVIIILPLAFYFSMLLLSIIQKKRNHKQQMLQMHEGEVVRIEAPIAETAPVVEGAPVKEKDRRNFFRVVTSAGIGGLVLYLIFPQRAEAAFFGSMPGPGTITLKDTTGAQIDPAIKSPTDGYAVANIDSADYPYYYGFVNKDAAWYIMRENPENTFTYSKGTSSFATNWTDRASLTYATFDVTF